MGREMWEGPELPHSDAKHRGQFRYISSTFQRFCVKACLRLSALKEQGPLPLPLQNETLIIKSAETYGSSTTVERRDLTDCDKI